MAKNVYFYVRDLENELLIGSITLVPFTTNINAKNALVYGKDRKRQMPIAEPTIFADVHEGKYSVELKGPNTLTSFTITVPTGSGNINANAIIT